MTILSLVAILVLAGVGFWAWRRNAALTEQRQAAETKNLPYAKDELRLENVGPGAVLHVTGIGPDMVDYDLEVISRHTYRQGESSWYELECSHGGGKLWLGMEEDDELEVTVGLRKLKLRDLGINKDDLVKMDDDEDGKFEFEGKTWWYEDSDKAVFYRHSLDKEAERFTYWEFEPEDETAFISVERWSDNSWDVTYSEPVKLSQITVYSLSK